MEIRVLGPVELVDASGGAITITGAKMRGLVAMLALEAGSTVSTPRLIDALWGEHEGDGLNRLQVVVSNLRRLLAGLGETDRVVTRPTGYELHLERDAVDALRFEALLDEGRHLGDDPQTLVDRLARALRLWRGPPLSGVPDTELTHAIRARLEALRSVAVEDMVDAELALGRHRRLAPELEALVAEDPLRERRWGQLIRALYGSGRQADALRAFQRARGALHGDRRRTGRRAPPARGRGPGAGRVGARGSRRPPRRPVSSARRSGDGEHPPPARPVHRTGRRARRPAATGRAPPAGHRRRTRRRRQDPPDPGAVPRARRVRRRWRVVGGAGRGEDGVRRPGGLAALARCRRRGRCRRARAASPPSPPCWATERPSWCSTTASTCWDRSRWPSRTC